MKSLRQFLTRHSGWLSHLAHDSISVKVGDNFYKRLRLFAGAYGRGRAWLEKGVSDLETGRIIGPSLKAAMERRLMRLNSS